MTRSGLFLRFHAVCVSQTKKLFYEYEYKHILCPESSPHTLRMRGRTPKEKEFLRRFGLRVQQLRKRAGLTQEELAERLDINQDMISRLENGHVGILFSRLVLLAEALGVPPHSLLKF